MQREIVITEDGSTSLFVKEIDEYFHSHFGAVQESEHIFMQAGFHAAPIHSKQQLSILEIGFGTGLNCFLTYVHHLQTDQNVYYEGIELYPLQPDEVLKLNYPLHHSSNLYAEQFLKMHQLPWNELTHLAPHFQLLKRQESFVTAHLPVDRFDLVYFDAFSPDKQPEMWTEEQFAKIYQAMKSGGVLVTYCTKGIVKRALKSVGFQIEKLPGPKGKREILRGSKLAN